jgi:hypothetical protein
MSSFSLFWLKLCNVSLLSQSNYLPILVETVKRSLPSYFVSQIYSLHILVEVTFTALAKLFCLSASLLWLKLGDGPNRVTLLVVFIRVSLSLVEAIFWRLSLSYFASRNSQSPYFGWNLQTLASTRKSVYDCMRENPIGRSHGEQDYSLSLSFQRTM